ncbi:MAG TPA: hypothetical protein DEG71_11320 [Clostridiales bacterium]|nr:hypothetical protein [Clostridiales bacterium]
MLNGCGIKEKHYNFYAFRHTFCTNLIHLGIDITTVAKLMGDSSLELILLIYNNINKNDMRVANEKYIGMLENMNYNRDMQVSE